MSNAPPKKSKAPALLGGCGCLSFLLGVALLAAWYAANGRSGFHLPHTGADVAHYANTREGRTGNLAENYVGFEFDYPKSWELRASDPDNINYVTVEKKVDEKTWENLNVGYLKPSGSAAGDAAVFPQLVSQLEAQFSGQFQGLQKVSEGPTRVGDLDGYEALFSGTMDAGGKPVSVYLRTILLPTPDHAKGVALVMLGTSFHPDLKEPADLGTKGEMPVILGSFKFAD